MKLDSDTVTVNGLVWPKLRLGGSKLLEWMLRNDLQNKTNKR